MRYFKIVFFVPRKSDIKKPGTLQSARLKPRTQVPKLVLWHRKNAVLGNAPERNCYSEFVVIAFSSQGFMNNVLENTENTCPCPCRPSSLQKRSSGLGHRCEVGVPAAPREPAQKKVGHRCITTGGWQCL